MVVQNCGLCSILSFIIFLHFLPGSFGTYFNCDPVNQGHYCLCAQGEPGLWDIQCPARILEVYPVSLKLAISPYDPEEASLRIICDPNKGHFGWRLVQGLDFENENITFSITSLEISYCPLISTVDLQNFFLQMKLDSEDIQKFSYQTWQQNVTFPSDFLKIMPNLEIVDLRNNRIESLPSFQGLPYLNQLNLRGNRLTNIPRETFTTNHNLEQIHLGGNLLSKLQAPIFPDSLIFLDLVDNRIKTIANESFSNLKNLQFLYLNNNPLERVEGGAFIPLKNLTELSLDNSKLFSLPLLKHLPKLTNLSISYSLFTSTKLVTTTLSPDELMDATTESFTENTNYYTSTVATQKSIMTMTTGSPDYGEVINEEDQTMLRERSEDLSTAGNQELIGDLYSLKKLILINDDLKSLSWLGYLPNLTDLVLSRNELQSVPDGFFENIPSAVYVDFSKNVITELSEIDAPLMTYLDLSNNYLRTLDQHYFKLLKQLRVLLLSSNKIEYVHPKAFETLENLMILDLSNNRISFEQGPPTMAPQLKYDIMTMSTIGTTTTIEEEKVDQFQPHNHSPLQFLTKVERVNLKNNLITKVFMDWTFVPNNLKSLDLSHNKIKSLHPRDLYFVSQDVRFDLRFNEITDIDMDFADLLLEPLENKNVVVLLDGNPINCDCHAISFKKFSVKSYHLQYSDLRCASPDLLRGRKFAEIPTKDLRCMVSQSCPQGCSCWELPSENLIKMDCNNLKFLTSRDKSLKNFTDVYEPLEFEVDLSMKNLEEIDASLMKEITPEFRLINLTNTGLTSLEFMQGFLPSNNHTKFALSKNPLACPATSFCKFQEIWYKHFKRIIDIRGLTCITGNSTELTFQDIARNSACADDAMSEEIRFLIVILAIIIPVIIATIICITKIQRDKITRRKRSRLRKAESVVGTLGAQPRSYTPTRSKVVDMDNSRF